MDSLRMNVNKISDYFIKELFGINADSVKENIPLSKFSRWKVGGRARCIFTPFSIDDLIKVVRLAHELKQPYLVIGSTSNLLFSDEGLDILAIHLNSSLSNIQYNGNEVIVEAGAWVPGFARTIANQGLSGLEHIIGIPGTMGGLVCMNGGSMRKGIGERVTSVKALTHSGEVKEYSQNDCLFAYRSSIFQENNEIILSVTLKLDNAHNTQIKKEMLSILRSRRRKFPLKLPNCGSVFVSNPVLYEKFGPPGSVIEKVGLKGHRKGGAEISRLHGNFIVNIDNASASDVLYLIYIAKRKVFRLTGFDLKSETIYIEPNGELSPTHIKADIMWGGN